MKGIDEKLMNDQVKLIFSGKLARELLRIGYQIVDVRPHREDPNRTVFVFKDVPGLKEDVRRLTVK